MEMIHVAVSQTHVLTSRPTHHRNAASKILEHGNNYKQSLFAQKSQTNIIRKFGPLSIDLSGSRIESWYFRVNNLRLELAIYRVCNKKTSVKEIAITLEVVVR